MPQSNHRHPREQGWTGRKALSHLLKLLYDYPEGKRDGSVFRYTKASIERSEWTIEDLEDLGYPTDIEHAPEYVVKIADGSPLTFDTIYEYPKKAALIIDNMVASSGEQSVLNTRLVSHRTTIYGRDNTMGCIDTGNCQIFESARKPLVVQYSTTYSMRYEKVLLLTSQASLPMYASPSHIQSVSPTTSTSGCCG